MSRIVGSFARDFRTVISLMYFVAGLFLAIGMYLDIGLLTIIGGLIAGFGMIVPYFVMNPDTCFFDITGSCAVQDAGPGVEAYLLCLAAIVLSSVMLYLDFSKNPDHARSADYFWIFLIVLALAITIGNIITEINKGANSIYSTPEEGLLLSVKDVLWLGAYVLVYFRIKRFRLASSNIVAS